MTCTTCGGTIAVGDRYCTGCGRPASAVDVAEAGAEDAPTAVRAMAAGSEALTSSRAGGASLSETPSRRVGRSAHVPPTKWLAVGAAVAVLVLVLVVASVRGGGGDGASPTGIVVPRQIESQWRDSFESMASFGGSPRAVFIAESDGGVDGVVRARSLDNGDELWESDVDFEWPFIDAVADDVVVVSMSDDDDERVLVGFDADDGTELWQDAVDGYVLTLGGRTYLAEDDDTGQLEQLSLLDVSSGETSERISADPLLVFGDQVVGIDDDEAQLYDLATLDAVGRPIAIDEDWTILGLEGDRLLVGSGDEIIRLDDAGDAERTTELDVDGISSARAVDGLLVVQDTAGDVVVAEPADDAADEIWREQGYLDTIVGDTVLVADDDELTALGLRDGDRRWDADLGAVTASPGSGVALITRHVADLETEALDVLTGDRLWRADGDVVAFDGGVVMVETDDDEGGGDFEVYR